MTLDDSLLVANGILDVPEVGLFRPVQGGGIYNDGVLEVTRSQINFNAATFGSGIFNHGANIFPAIGQFDDGFIRNGLATIDQSVLAQNLGEGAYNDGIFNATNTVFSGNTQAIYNTRVKDFDGRLDDDDPFNLIGAGVVFDSPGITPGVLTLNNSTVVSNTGAGGSIVNSDSFRLSSIHPPSVGPAFPTAPGLVFDSLIGLTLEEVPGTADLSNTILLDGTPNCDPGLGAGPITSLGHNLSDDDSCELTEPTDLRRNPTLGTFEIDLGPSGLQAAPGPLLAGNPAIDAGNPAAVGDAPGCDPIDYLGENRPIDGNRDLTAVCDIGAFEFQPDTDGDGVDDPLDNCVNTPNPGQEDRDGDGVGDVCDNAPDDPNPGQEDADSDGDGIGDLCDPDNDADGDGFVDSLDNCVDDPNPGQEDRDGDGVGDACDNAPISPTRARRTPTATEWATSVKWPA